jgi:hypothetical protein
MRFLGQTMHGVYVDDCQGIHPDIINCYYGVHGPHTVRRPGQTGAGQLEDEGDLDGEDNSDDGTSEDGDEWEDIQDQLMTDISANIHHSPVPVPNHRMPFCSQPAADVFNGALDELCAQGLIPNGFGMTQEEWGDNGYPSYEDIHPGQRGRKALRINLPDFIWRPRAELWVQALHVMLRVFEMEQGAVIE